MAKHDRLDTPGRRSPWLPRVRVSDDAFGDFAESAARFMGPGRFIVWILLNVNPATMFDQYPLMLLTLMLSIEAAYSAPLILLAQNRQEYRDRLSLDEDRRVAAQSRADMDFLAREIAALRQSVGEVATRDYVRTEIRDQLQELLTELERGDQPSARAGSPTADADRTVGRREARPSRRE